MDAYVVERHDQEDGSITYEVWDRRAASYRRLCSLNEWYDGGSEDEEELELSTAKADAELIVHGLNLVDGNIAEGMRYRETMRATQAPDVYAGASCGEHEDRWVGSAEGDKDGDGPIGPLIELAANTFPPGTIVKVEEPECPRCGSVPAGGPPRGGHRKWECDCAFDWKAWAEEQFS